MLWGRFLGRSLSALQGLLTAACTHTVGGSVCLLLLTGPPVLSDGGPHHGLV